MRSTNLVYDAFFAVAFALLFVLGLRITRLEKMVLDLRRSNQQQTDHASAADNVAATPAAVLKDGDGGRTNRD